MGMKDRRDWLRIMLAFVAVLLVAGPGLVLAGAPTASYAYATRIVILGPRSVAVGTTAHYDVQVTLTDGTTFTVTAPDSATTMTADQPGLSGFDFTPSTSTSPVHLMATYTSPSGKAVTGTRGITVTP